MTSAASIYETSPPIPSQELLDRNAKYAEGHKVRVGPENWENFPKNAIITCMDSRIHPHKQLGLADHDTVIIRNGSGRASEVLTSILISQSFGTRHFMLIKHSDCGTFYSSGPKIIKNFKAHAKNPEAIDEYPEISKLGSGNKTLDEIILGDVEFLRNSPLIFEDTTISGWAFDDETGKIRQVA